MGMDLIAMFPYPFSKMALNFFLPTTKWVCLVSWDLSKRCFCVFGVLFEPTKKGVSSPQKK